jgi:hypothetical protein
VETYENFLLAFRQSKALYLSVTVKISTVGGAVENFEYINQILRANQVMSLSFEAVVFVSTPLLV